MAITWQNVFAPDSSNILKGMRESTADMSKTLSGFADMVGEEGDRRDSARVQNYLGKLASFGSPEEVAAFEKTPEGAAMKAGIFNSANQALTRNAGAAQQTLLMDQITKRGAYQDQQLAIATKPLVDEAQMRYQQGDNVGGDAIMAKLQEQFPKFTGRSAVQGFENQEDLRRQTAVERVETLRQQAATFQSGLDEVGFKAGHRSTELINQGKGLDIQGRIATTGERTQKAQAIGILDKVVQTRIEALQAFDKSKRERSEKETLDITADLNKALEDPEEARLLVQAYSRAALAIDGSFRVPAKKMAEFAKAASYKITSSSPLNYDYQAQGLIEESILKYLKDNPIDTKTANIDREKLVRAVTDAEAQQAKTLFDYTGINFTAAIDKHVEKNTPKTPEQNAQDVRDLLVASDSNKDKNTSLLPPLTREDFEKSTLAPGNPGPLITYDEYISGFPPTNIEQPVKVPPTSAVVPAVVPNKRLGRLELGEYRMLGPRAGKNSEGGAAKTTLDQFVKTLGQRLNNTAYVISGAKDRDARLPNKLNQLTEEELNTPVPANATSSRDDNIDASMLRISTAPQAAIEEVTTKFVKAKADLVAKKISKKRFGELATELRDQLLALS